ncbi:RNA-directed DNA polymerase from mobile element jockey, partial [Stegodyphus mimosarum]
MPSEICSYIKTLKNGKSPGYDQITNMMVKRFPMKTICYLTKVFNIILKHQHFPESWKLAKVIPILKPGKPPSEPGSYRPISLLSTISKLLEAVLLNRMQNFIDERNLLIPYQFGFRSKHSNTHQLYRVVELISSGLKTRKVTGGLFLDVAKAFDRVWLDALIYKLHHLGFPGHITNIIHSYLTGRHFVVHVSGTLSSPRAILAGVPQGSLLGPTLFNLYVNDIPTTDNTTLAMYADDTAILTQTAFVGSAIQRLQNHIQLLETWLTKWKVKINVDKTTAILFTKKEKFPNQLKLYGETIPWAKQVLYLGVILSKRFSWNPHITCCLKKFRARKASLNPLIARNSVLSIDNKLLIYKTMLRSILCYACPVWAYSNKSIRSKLQTAQNCVLRQIVCAPWYIRNAKIHEELKIELYKMAQKKIGDQDIHRRFKVVTSQEFRAWLKEKNKGGHSSIEMFARRKLGKE